MQTKTRIITTIIALALTLSANAALSAAQIMERTANVFTKPASVTASFSITSGKHSQSGSLTMGKRLFTFNTGTLSVWYDGKTQWTLDPKSREVTITVPTADEVAESNPFALLASYTASYYAAKLQSPDGQYKIKLTRKTDRTAIKTITLTVDAKNFHVRKIIATSDTGDTLTITVKTIQTGKALPKSYYTFNPKANPGYQINDLR